MPVFWVLLVQGENDERILCGFLYVEEEINDCGPAATRSAPFVLLKNQPLLNSNHPPTEAIFLLGMALLERQEPLPAPSFAAGWLRNYSA